MAVEVHAPAMDAAVVFDGAGMGIASADGGPVGVGTDLGGGTTFNAPAIVA